MKYILFLLSILLFNLPLFADPGSDLGTGIQVTRKPSTGLKSPYGTTNTYGIGTTNIYGTTSTGGSLTDYSVKPDYSLSSALTTTTYTYTYSSTSGGLTVSTSKRCSTETPENCLLISSCIEVGGYWNGIDGNCGRTTCHYGTTQDPVDPTKCLCNNDEYAFVRRGNFLQSCPSVCFSKPNQIYSFTTKECECIAGYTMATNGVCNQNPAPTPEPPPASPAADCLRELSEKADSCESAANTAVTKCEPEGETDSIAALRGLLMSGAGTAAENCDRAATASTSGFYQTEDNRKSCDDGINSCKSTCTDAKTYLNANKERAITACRERAYQDQVNAGPPLPPDRFNPMWDSENRANLDREFQQLMAKVDTSKTTCESGTAVKNREKLSAAMNDMNTAAVDASKCVCQLNSGSADCSKAVGPADCSSNPDLPGCAKVADNCFDPKNTSQKCICFRNPNSIACKGEELMANLNVKNSDLAGSAFAATKTTAGSTDASSLAAGGGIGNVTSSDLRGLGGGKVADDGGSGVEAPPESSGTTVSSMGNAAPSTGGGSAPSAAPNAAGAAKSEEAIFGKKLGGFFETAKSALGGLFKKSTGSGDSASGDYRDSGGSRSNQEFDARRFRPRAVVRGIASEEELAGKHEDIWKVMNKQYKVQDQKDKFIFDAGTN